MEQIASLIKALERNPSEPDSLAALEFVRRRLDVSDLDLGEVELLVILVWYVASIFNVHDEVIPFMERACTRLESYDRVSYIEATCMLIFCYLVTGRRVLAQQVLNSVHARSSKSERERISIILGKYLEGAGFVSARDNALSYIQSMQP